MWSSGEAILLRRVVRGRVWFAHGATVVRDVPELLVLWVPTGTESAGPQGDILGDWTLGVGASQQFDVLLLSPTGRAHTIMSAVAGPKRGWYVNLETRTRTARGIDIDDHYLDLWAYPNGSWEWLDEDELEAALAAGAIMPETAAAARAEGERVIREWPFPTGWEEWRPPEDWTPPPLPAGWDVV